MLLLTLSSNCYSTPSTRLCPVLAGDQEKLVGLDLMQKTVGYKETIYRKQGKIRWAKRLHFSRFSRAPRKFSRESLYNGVV